jgi:hypothetical protein
MTYVYRDEKLLIIIFSAFPPYIHWDKADDRNCNYGHPKMADMKLGKNNLWTFHKEITNYDCKMYMKEKIRLKKMPKMTVTDHNSAVQLRSSQFSVTVIFAIF